MCHCYHRTAGHVTLEPVYHVSLEPVYHVSLKPVYHVSLEPVYHVSLKPVYHESLEPVYHVSLIPVYHVSLEPVYHVSLEPMYHVSLTGWLQNCTQKESPPHIKPENNQKIILDTSAFWSGCNEVTNNVTKLKSLKCVAGRSFRSSRERWWYIAASRCKAKDNIVVSQFMHNPYLLPPLSSSTIFYTILQFISLSCLPSCFTLSSPISSMALLL